MWVGHFSGQKAWLEIHSDLNVYEKLFWAYHRRALEFGDNQIINPILKNLDPCNSSINSPVVGIVKLFLISRNFLINAKKERAIFFLYWQNRG